jgi:signal transduction histidine kinase
MTIGSGATERAWPQQTRVGRRLLSLVLRPTARPLGWGVIAATALIAGETVLVLILKRTAPDNSYGAIFLLGVLVIAAGWNFSLAVATSLASTAVYAWFHVEDGGGLTPALCVFFPVVLLASVLASQARVRAAESEQRRAEAAARAGQQTALRHVATMVARGADPTDVHPVAVSQLAMGLDVAHVTLTEFDGQEHCVVLASHDAGGQARFVVGERLSLDGDGVTARIGRTGRHARVDDYSGVEGSLPARLAAMGLHCGVGAPVTVEGRVRGALVVGSARDEPLPAETEASVGDFADLIATAIGNAETRAELTASRARVVAAADQARRGIERDLHDGAQQRVVTLGLGLRALEASIPEGDVAVRKQVDNLVHGMADLYTELQELSRGIHPAILSKGGLGPAVKSVARRSPVPVELRLDVPERLSESVEVAAYYVVAEALTNVAKHAGATVVTIDVSCDSRELRLAIADDGVGGATTGGGSGLIGLRDRVAAVSGVLEVSSPPGDGTTVTARIPVPGSR